MNLYLTRHGRLKRKDNTLSFEILNLPEAEYLHEEESALLEDGAADAKHALPIEAIDAVYLFGEVTVNSKLFNFLGQQKVPVHYFNYFGHHSGTFLPHAEQISGDVVLKQAEAFSIPDKRAQICRAILNATFHNILSNLQYYDRRKGLLSEEILRMRALQTEMLSAHEPETLMGYEGQIRKIYYSAWPKWLDGMPQAFTRQYNPPDNPINAMISFLNSLLYTACVSEIYRTALYPGISYLHAPQSRRFSLALDLVEPFKPVMVDRLLFRLFNRNEITPRNFREYSNGVLLTDDARKKVLEAWDEQLRTTVDYPALNRSVSYRQLLRLDCYKLIKFLLEGEDYRPYTILY